MAITTNAMPAAEEPTPDSPMIEEALRRWEEEHRRGIELSPEELCPAASPEQLHVLQKEIDNLRLFERLEQSFQPTRFEPRRWESYPFKGISIIDEGGQGVVMLAED